MQIMESVRAKNSSSPSPAMLGPGFRFHPTDEELVRYYLKRKIYGKPLRFDAISEIDIYKSEPWDLPCMSKLKTRDLEWYFFSVLDKKFGNKARTNRATEKGYWKTTGKDRAIYHNKQIVGMKKTLVYHNGRAPSGQRSNWVMHEYRLAGGELEKPGIVQDAFVLCRVFQKSGSGPKNGEQYGAPFVEEEWEDDDALKETAEVLDFGDDGFLNEHDLEQILQSNVTSDAPLLSGFQSSDGSTNEETTEIGYGDQNLMVLPGKQYLQLEQPHDKISCDILTPCNVENKSLEHDCVGESSKLEDFDDLDFLLDEPFLDAFGNEEGFIEANDILYPDQTNTSAFDMLDEYLSFDDANENLPYFTYDSTVKPESNSLTSHQPLLSQKESFPGTEDAFLPSGELIYCDTVDASSKQKFSSGQSDTFINKASKLLGTIPAPPAFAAEFPPKDAVYRLSSMAKSSNLAHGNAGSGKHGNFRLILSFGFAHGDDGSASLESRFSLVPGKNGWTVFRGWFSFMFMWVLLASLCLKLGSYAYANYI